MHSNAIALSLLFLSASTWAGTVRIVAPSGAPYPDIQSAVDASASGDVILVKTGSYAGFTVGNKSLSIVADAAQVVQVDGTTTIHDLGSARTIALCGLRFAGTSSAAVALQLTNDTGHVRLVDCRLEGWDEHACLGSGSPSPMKDALRASACPDLVLSGTSLVGGDGPPGPISIGPGNSGAGLTLLVTNAALYDCGLTGGTGTAHPLQCDCGGNGGDAGNCAGALLFASGCTFAGGDGGLGQCVAGFGCSEGGSGGDGLQLASNSMAYLLGSLATGGLGGGIEGSGGSCCIGGNPGHAQNGPASSFIVLAPAPRSFSLRTPIREATTANCAFTGIAGDEVGLLVASEPAFALVTGIEGVRAVAFGPGTTFLRLGSIPAGGVLSVALPIGALPAGQEADVRHLQPIFGEPSGVRVFGPPRVLVVLDSAF